MTTSKRKTIEIARKRIPLRKLLHGKEIREAAKALEDFRLELKEQEFLYGGKITVHWGSYGDAEAVVSRPETDKEYAERLEKARIAAELKKRREEIKRQKEAAAAKEAEIRKRAQAKESIRKMARDLGLSGQELVDLLDK